MILLFRVKWLTLFILMGLCHCGTDQDSQLQGGSWGGHVGGSFYETPLQNLTQDLVRAEFYYVTKPVGLGVNHEFIGVKLIRRDLPADFYTSGLIAEDDLTYFRQGLHDRRSLLFAATEQPNALAKIKQAVDHYFRESWYQNPVVFTGGMVITPLLGRPCAKVARLLKHKIRANASGHKVSSGKIEARMIGR